MESTSERAQRATQRDFRPGMDLRTPPGRVVFAVGKASHDLQARYQHDATNRVPATYHPPRVQ